MPQRFFENKQPKKLSAFATKLKISLDSIWQIVEISKCQIPSDVYNVLDSARKDAPIPKKFCLDQLYVEYFSCWIQKRFPILSSIVAINKE